MKIENIIDDIINDTTEIKHQFEEKMKKECPGLNFSINLPGLEELSAIKVIEISIIEENYNPTFSVDLHTHNGYRVFEHSPLNGNQHSVNRHQLQDFFISTLREIIKKRKSRKAIFQRSATILM